jgi:hypothetical protein
MSVAMSRDTVDAYRRLVQQLLEGGIPQGEDFDACRAVLRTRPSDDMGFQAVCMLLEGALAEPNLSIDDTQLVVALLKALAAGTLRVEELL